MVRTILLAANVEDSKEYVTTHRGELVCVVTPHGRRTVGRGFEGNQVRVTAAMGAHPLHDRMVGAVRKFGNGVVIFMWSDR